MPLLRPIFNFVCCRCCCNDGTEHDKHQQRQERQALFTVSDESDDYHSSKSSFQTNYGWNGNVVSINSDTVTTTGATQKIGFDRNLERKFDPTSTTGISLTEISHKPILPTSGIQDTHHRHQLDSKTLQQNQVNGLVKQAQLAQMSNVSHGSQSQPQTNLSTPSYFGKSYHPDSSVSRSSVRSVHEEDLVKKLVKEWNDEMKIDQFIRSEVNNLPQSYQDLLTEMVKNCHKTIEDHLKPHWSTTLARYTQIVSQQRQNKDMLNNSNRSKEIKNSHFENEDLISCLKVYVMQKVSFDNAILSCFNEIVNQYESGDHDKDVDFDDQMIQDTTEKINLEIKRLCMRLSIYTNCHKIQQQFNTNQIVIVKSQTDSCHSTQIPQYVTELNIGKVICAQPTRFAAISLANHLTQECAQIDSSIHYIVNHNSLHQESHTDSIMTIVTDSILLDILIDEPILSSYSCVIVDQAHQRSLYTDILLAFLKQVLTHRHDLKLIIISSNIDTKLFSDYFNDCPIISISNNVFPVDIKWCNNHVYNYLDKALDTVVDIHNSSQEGDILVFLVTSDETEKACVDINKRLANNSNAIIALPLYDGLQASDLQHLFKIDSGGRRKIIFTTNCAETSVTIPGIRYVIDTGLIQDRIYNNRSNCHVLRIQSISRNSAIQRCDHVRRIQSGICYRLYSQQVYDNMPQSSQPEIKRVHLSSVILKMIKLGITDIMNFDFIQSPSSQNISDSLDTLHMLSAITARVPPLSLTWKGKLFCKLPLEPRLSALIVNAEESDILPEGIIIASALSMSCNLNCRYGSEEDKQDLDLINTQFRYSDGDVISTAEVYIKWRSLYREREYRSWCYRNKINWKLMQHLDYKVRELQQSLRYSSIINQKRLKIPSQLKPQSRDKLRQLIFQSYHDQLALFTGLDKIGFVTTYSDNQYMIHNSSTLLSLGINPKFVVYQEILTTWDDFLMNITPVDEEWLQSMVYQYAKIKNTLNNLVVTQTIDHLGSAVLSEYDTSDIDKIVKKLLQDENIRCSIIKNTNQGSLQLTTIKSKMPKLLEIIYESIMCKKEKLTKAIKILSKKDDHDAPRLIIGRGIIVKDLILSKDCIELKIALRYTGDENPDENTAIDAINQVRAHIISSGKLAIDVDSIGTNKSNDCKYIQFDTIIYQELRSQSLLKELESKNISGYEINIENRSLANCNTNISLDRTVVQFRWPHGPQNGKVIITCSDHSTAINVLSDFPLTIYNQIIYASIDEECSNKLIICQIPNSITASDIKMAIPPTHRETIMEVSFHRIVASIDDEIPLNNLKSTLRNVLDKNGYCGRYSEISIKPISSVQENVNIIADVAFDAYGDAVSAVQTLNDGVYEELMKEPVSARLVYSCIIKCKQEVYACLAKEVNRIQETLNKIQDDQEKFVNINIHSYNKKYPLTSITIKSWNQSSLKRIVGQISKIIEPVRVWIDVTEVLDYLNSKHQKSILMSLSHRFAVYAKIDWKSQCIFIYGAKEMKEQALSYCQKEIDLLFSKCNIINLVGNNQPKNLIKVMIKRYGINLNKLIQLSGIDAIRLNRKNKTLIVIGDKESYAKVLSEIDSCCSTLGVSTQESSYEILANECVACFCQVDDDNYRLQYCGHLYCQQCITRQMNNAIQASSFPLNCANCNQGFVIQDLEWLLTKLPQPQLYDVLITEFIRRQPDVWHYCPTPECESVYKRSESYQVFTCPECQQKTCRGCDTEDHPGYACNEIQLYRKNANASLETLN